MARLPTIRDLILLAIGGYGFLHEVQGTTDRPYLILASLALMGLPVFLPNGLAELFRVEWKPPGKKPPPKRRGRK